MKYHGYNSSEVEFEGTVRLNLREAIDVIAEETGTQEMIEYLVDYDVNGFMESIFDLEAVKEKLNEHYFETVNTKQYISNIMKEFGDTKVLKTVLEYYQGTTSSILEAIPEERRDGYGIRMMSDRELIEELYRRVLTRKDKDNTSQLNKER